MSTLRTSSFHSVAITMALVSTLLVNTSYAYAYAETTTLQCNNENTATTATTTHFTDNEDGTISDPKTGLIWKKCSEGQSWDSSNNTCTGSAQAYNWQQALQQAQDVNGGVGEDLDASDWRVPNIKELSSIVEQRCYIPAVNVTAFPNTPSSLYWSSSPYAPNGASAWFVDFFNGNDNAYFKYGGYHVRLVRNGQ